MAIFQYTVKNEHGETIRGRVEAQTKEQASSILRNRSLLVISLKPQNETLLTALNSSLFGIRNDEIVSFTRQLSTMVTAGLTLTESLHILQQQSKPAMERMIGSILREIEGGSTFAKALQSQGKTFSPVYIQLVRAGETAGMLDTVLSRLADTMEKQREFAGKVKGALIYPIIVIIAMIIVAFVMMVFVIPKLTQMYKELGAELPLLTQLLIDVSDFFARFWWLVIMGVIAGGIAFRGWHQTEKGRRDFDRFLLKIPILGLLRQKVILTEFCRTMSLLLSAGISVLQALEILTDAQDNMIYRDALAVATDQVEKGVPLSQTISKYDFFPPIVSQMIGVGEETGKVDEVLLKLSIYFESESEQEVRNLTSAFEPLIMVVLGLGVGVLVIAIIMPIYNITSSF
ncbi:type II secretion system F family protein [Patescibacteria group bacterium]|nr:type II secretion system F family protein [Patescibacteria group bacterium]